MPTGLCIYFYNTRVASETWLILYLVAVNVQTLYYCNIVANRTEQCFAAHIADNCHPSTRLGTCHDVLPQGYACECPHEYRGPECQATTRTFNRVNSYIWLEPLSAYELSSLSFEFMAQPNTGSGLLVYQGALRQGI